jgi:tellurite methyltransferase
MGKRKPTSPESAELAEACGSRTHPSRREAATPTDLKSARVTGPRALPSGLCPKKTAGENAAVIDVAALFGQIDIYLFDQVLRGRIAAGMSVFDAGCGQGRNLIYFLNQGFDVSGVDPDPDSIHAVRALAEQVAPRLPASNFRAEAVEANSFPDRSADVVLSSAVLHFAHDEAHFRAMLEGTWRVLKPKGLFFCRLASSIGMEGRFSPLGGRRFGLPDGSERFLVDEPYLLKLTAELGGTLLDPLKTTVVQDRRCMTTWVVRKNA